MMTRYATRHAGARELNAIMYAPDVRRPVAWKRPSSILVPVGRASTSGIPMLRTSKQSHAVISITSWMASKYHVCLLGKR